MSIIRKTNFPIDERGIPITYVSYMVLKTMFNENRFWFSSKELSQLLVGRESEVREICEQLTEVSFLIKDNNGSYKYNTSSNAPEQQAEFEKYLVSVRLEGTPVHLILPFSPSYPVPCDLQRGSF